MTDDPVVIPVRDGTECLFRVGSPQAKPLAWPAALAQLLAEGHDPGEARRLLIAAAVDAATPPPDTPTTSWRTPWVGNPT